MPPGVYLDECVDLRLADELRQRGIAVTIARDVPMLHADDEEQLVHASERDLVLLTHNRRHFWQLHTDWRARGRAHGGIIHISPSRLPLLSLRAAMMLDWMDTLTERRSQYFQWGYLQHELERSYRLPGYTEDQVRFVCGQSLPTR